MADIRVQKRDGTFATYNGVTSVVLPTSGGQTATFSLGGGSILSISQGSVSTPTYAEGERHGQSGDLPTLTMWQTIPSTATISEVHFYTLINGGALLDNDTLLYVLPYFAHTTNYTTELTQDNQLKVTVTSPTGSTLDSQVASIKRGFISKSGLLIIMYST